MRTRTTTVLCLATPLLLALASCGSDDKQDDGAAKGIAVNLTDNGCDPLALTAPTGSVSFAVTNKTDDQAEFEILSKTPEILTEKFVDAGKTETYAVALAPGDYEIICGRPSDPRTQLTITGDSGAGPTTTVVDASALAAATAEYQTFVIGQVEELETNIKAFTDAVRAGDTETAKELYPVVRVNWEIIEPVAELFPDSDGVIDSRSDDFPKAEADPDFTGFHAIEYGLWAQGTIDGAEVDLPALADRLDADITSLATSIKTIDIQPQVMTNGAAALIEEAAQTKTTGEEDRYSHTDLATFAANVDGAKKVVDLVGPLLRGVNATLADDLAASFERVNALLDTYQDGDAFQSYENVTEADRAKFKTELAQLSEELSQVTGSLGLTVAS